MKKYFIIFSAIIASLLLQVSCLGSREFNDNLLIARGGGPGGWGGGGAMQRTPCMSRAQYPAAGGFAAGATAANRRDYNSYPQEGYYGGYYPEYTEPQPQYPQQYPSQYPQQYLPE